VNGEDLRVFTVEQWFDHFVETKTQVALGQNGSATRADDA